MGLCSLASVVTWAAVFLLPVFVQSVQGRSALAAGLAMAPQGLITGLSAALAPRWLTRLTVRVTVMSGFTVLGVASLGLLFVVAATPLWLIALILACRSVSVGLVINPLLQALTQPLRPDQLGDANTLFNTWQRIAGSFGIGTGRRPVRDAGPHPGPGGRPALRRPGPGRDRPGRRARRAGSARGP